MGSTLAEQQALYEKAFNEEVGALEEVDENSSLQSNGGNPIAAAPPPVEEHGPRLEVPARHISFSGMPNELVSDFLAVGNDGPCVIHYFWENVTHRHPAALNTEPPKRRSRGAIAWKQMSGQISPGQTQKWPLFFLSDQAGVPTTPLLPLTEKQKWLTWHTVLSGKVAAQDQTRTQTSGPSACDHSRILLTT